MPATPGNYVDPEEKKIEDKRKALIIPTPADFKTEASRKALYRLNMKNSTKDDSAIETAKKQAKENQAKPFVFHKGGTVKKSGVAKVQAGESLLRKKAKKGPRKRA
jgi:hypothetical protein